MLKKAFSFLLVLLVALWVGWPLLTPGFVPTHDGDYHIVRFYEFDKSVKAGVLFPRWAPGLNSGFGLPLFNFFYPLPNYVAEAFHLLGFSLVDCLRLTLGAGLVLSALFAYLWLAEVWGVWGGLAGGIFYLLAPYHLVDVFVRGSVGEVWALVWLPAALWMVEKVRRKVEKVEKSRVGIYVFLGGLFFAFLILSHNILAMIFTPFLVSYMIFLILTSPRAKRLLITNYQLLITFFGLSLSCYFWLPALIEAKYVTGLKIVDITAHFPTFFQLLLPSWGTGFSVPGAFDQISFQIGIPHLLAVVVAIWFLLLGKKENKKRAYVFFFLTWLLVVIFLLLEVSLPLWKAVPLMNFLQYPWRFLSLVILLTSFLAGGAVVWEKKAKLLAPVFIFLALAFYSGYIRPSKYVPRSDNFYLDNPTWTEGTATLSNSFNTVWFDITDKKVKAKETFTQPDCRIKKLSGNTVKYEFEADCESAVKVKLGMAYFPGWKVLIDGSKSLIDFKDGLIGFEIPKGEHLIEVEFGDTPIRTLANGISLVSLLFGLLMVIF